MTTSLSFLSAFNNGLQITNQTMEIKFLSSTEKQELFIKLSKELKELRIKYIQMSELIGIEYSRFKTLRSRGKPILYPNNEELQALIQLHEKKFKPAAIEPEPEIDVKGEIKSLKERIKAQEAFNESTKIRLIEKLEILATRNIDLEVELRECKKMLEK